MMGERRLAQEAPFYQFSLKRHLPTGHWVRALSIASSISRIA